MKKNLILFIAAIALTINSCGNSTVTPGTYSIEGTWEYISEGGTVKKTWVFDENGLFSYHAITTGADNIVFIGTYESTGNVVTITYNEGTNTNQGDYSTTDSSLIMTMDYENGPTTYQRK